MYTPVRMRKVFLSACLVLLGVTISISFAGRLPTKGTIASGDGAKLDRSDFYKSTADSSKAVLSVEGMSCSGCIFTIKSALSKFEGIHEIIVDVSAEKAEIYYDDTKLKDLKTITAAITGAGYPAKVKKVIPRDQLKKDQDLLATRSELFIASVGGVDISRKDLETELADATRMYTKKYGQSLFATEQGEVLLNNLKGQIVSRLINEGIQLQEIQKAGFELDRATVDEAFQALLERKGVGLEAFKASLEKDGYSFGKFKKRFETRLLVNHYLDSEVFSGVSNDIEKRKRYTDWFNNAKILANVVYYDIEIEALVQNRSSGCGSSCSGSSGSCSGQGK